MPVPQTGKLGEDGQIIMLDPEDCRRAVSSVNVARLHAVKRINDIELFPAPGHESFRSRPTKLDPPALQILFKMRDQYLDAATPKERKATKDDPAPEPEQPNPIDCAKILSAMAKIALDLGAEANKVSTELQAIAQHEDRMKLEAKKLGEDSKLTWAQTVALTRVTSRDG